MRDGALAAARAAVRRMGACADAALLFFRRRCAPTLAESSPGPAPSRRRRRPRPRCIDGVAPLDHAGPATLTFLDNPRYAGAGDDPRPPPVSCRPAIAAKLPGRHGRARVRASPIGPSRSSSARLYPDAMRPGSVLRHGRHLAGRLHPSGSAARGRCHGRSGRRHRAAGRDRRRHRHRRPCGDRARRADRPRLLDRAQATCSTR